MALFYITDAFLRGIPTITNRFGEEVKRVFGTAGDDDFIFAATNYAGPRVTMIGGAGNDSFTKVPGVRAPEIRFYGDNAQEETGAPAIGPRNAIGNDRIDLGPGDRGISHGGQDKYIVHGTGASYAMGGRASARMDVENDVLIAAGDAGWEVAGFRFADVTINRDGTRTAEIRLVDLDLSSGNRLLDGQMIRLDVGNPGDARWHDAPEITFDRGERRAAADEWVESLVDDGVLVFG